MLLDHPELADAATANLIDFGFNESHISFKSAASYAKVGNYVIDLFNMADQLTLIIGVAAKVKLGQNDNNLLAAGQIEEIPIACDVIRKRS